MSGATGMDGILERQCLILKEHLDKRMDRQEALMESLLHSLRGGRTYTSEASNRREQRTMTTTDDEDDSHQDTYDPQRTWNLDLQREDEQRKFQAGLTEKNVEVTQDGRDSELLEGLQFTSTSWQEALLRFVSSSAFELMFGMLIVANSIYIGAQVSYAAHHPTDNEPLVFFIFTQVFAVCFLLELVFRVAAEGPHFFVSTCWQWNYLDIFLVLASLFEVVTEILARVSDVKAARVQNMSNVRIIRLVRVARLIRIFRIFRVVRFVRGLRVLIFSILCTLKALLWAMILLAIIVYVFGILFTQATIDWLPIDDAMRAAEGVDPAVEGALRRHFSSIPSSMFTLFKAVAGGLSWDDAVTPMENIHIIWVACFALYITFVYFAVLNVVTGVFCQAAIESASRDEDLQVQKEMANKQEYIQKVNNLFKNIDSNASGMLTISELEEHFNEESVRAYFRALDLDLDDAWTLFKLLDTNAEHSISINDFAVGCLRLKGPAKRIDVEKMMYDQNRMLKALAAFTEFVERNLVALGSLVQDTDMGDLGAAERLRGVAACEFLRESETILYSPETEGPSSGYTIPACQTSRSCSQLSSLSQQPAPASRGSFECYLRQRNA